VSKRNRDPMLPGASGVSKNEQEGNGRRRTNRMHRNTRLTLALVTNLLFTGLGPLFYRRYLFAILYFVPFVALRSSVVPELGLLQLYILGHYCPVIDRTITTGYSPRPPQSTRA
jgi:hypothetical protein